MEQSNRKLILLIEDDQFIRESLSDVLETEGHRVICASNGEEGVQALLNSLELPQLIFLDLMMPVRDGFFFREVQRADPRFSSVPVVIMSADGSVEEKQSRAQATGYLKKPVELEEILFAIKNYAN